MGLETGPQGFLGLFFQMLLSSKKGNNRAKHSRHPQDNAM